MIAERLTALRLETALSQQAVADELHMTRSAYSSYETGRRTPPLDVLVLLANYFNTTTDYLLGNSEERGPIPQLDERGRELLRLYQNTDQRGRETIYRMALQENTYYGERVRREGGRGGKN